MGFADVRAGNQHRRQDGPSGESATWISEPLYPPSPPPCTLARIPCVGAEAAAGRAAPPTAAFLRSAELPCEDASFFGRISGPFPPAAPHSLLLSAFTAAIEWAMVRLWCQEWKLPQSETLKRGLGRPRTGLAAGLDVGRPVVIRSEAAPAARKELRMQGTRATVGVHQRKAAASLVLVAQRTNHRGAVGGAVYRGYAAAAKLGSVLGSWGETMRDAVRNTESWKGRRTPTQDPSTDVPEVCAAVRARAGARPCAVTPRGHSAHRANQATEALGCQGYGGVWGVRRETL